MVENNKHFQISCPVFWGFNRYIDISELNTLQECINLFLDEHRNFLFEQNYIDLLNFFDAHRNEYHIHDMNMEKLKESSDTIYVCRHNHAHNDNNHNNHVYNDNNHVNNDNNHVHNSSCCTSELENGLNKDSYPNPNPNLY